MATGEIVKPREIVKANNELFRCKYTIKDVVAGRIFMAFASLVDHKDVKENQSFVEYRIAANSILSDTCSGGDNYKQLQDAARSLIGQQIELHISKKQFYFYNLFSKIGYEDGIIIGEFHKDLMPFFLIAKERFTKMQLFEYIQLPSIYSQAIFGLLKSWSDKNDITIKLSELHTMLDTPPSLRKDFYNFKARVLDKAYKDINEKTSLSYEWESIKNGRAVREIKFKLCKKSKSTTITMRKFQEIQPQGNISYLLYEKFLHKFPNPAVNRLNAYKKWSELYEIKIAPVAEDVPEDNNIEIMEFLENWKNSHENRL